MAGGCVAGVAWGHGLPGSGLEVLAPAAASGRAAPRPRRASALRRTAHDADVCTDQSAHVSIIELRTARRRRRCGGRSGDRIRAAALDTAGRGAGQPSPPRRPLAAHHRLRARARRDPMFRSTETGIATLAAAESDPLRRRRVALHPDRGSPLLAGRPARRAIRGVERLGDARRVEAAPGFARSRRESVSRRRKGSRPSAGPWHATPVEPAVPQSRARVRRFSSMR